MVFSRLRCHFCGARQSHSKRVKQFQCATCEAVNFLDGKGNIIDTPASVVANSHNTAPMPGIYARPARPQEPQSQQQQQPVFCRTCQQNQLIHNETLANYLPDDDDPRYAEFERRLPEFRAELDQRYPLICSTCAPLAQERIHQSDYYGMTKNAARLIAETRTRGGKSRKGMRDDWEKRTKRSILKAIRTVMYAGLAIQVAYHVFGIMSLRQAQREYTSAATTPICLIRAGVLRFDEECQAVFARYIPYTHFLAIGLLWFNTGRRYWYDGTHRIEAVLGQREYFTLQVIMLAVRSIVFSIVTSPTMSAAHSPQRMIAVHGFAALFLPFAQWLAESKLQPVKWKIHGSIMPSPSERDVLSAYAGPSQEHHLPQASEEDPFRLLRESGPSPFRAAASPQSKKALSPQRPYLSPPQESDDSDAMDTDPDPPSLAATSATKTRFTNLRPNIEPTHTWFNHRNTPPLGLSDMAANLPTPANSQDQHHQPQRLPAAFSTSRTTTTSFGAPSAPRPPFSVPVPPAPMSQERRLRNPWSAFATTSPRGPNASPPPPLSEQKDFMARMRAGVTPITMVPGETGVEGVAGRDFQVQKGRWRLKGDERETGLEERFGRFFGIEENGGRGGEGKGGGWFGGLVGR